MAVLTENILNPLLNGIKKWQFLNTENVRALIAENWRETNAC